MLLTITCTPRDGAGWPATDLGFLLHKNPCRVQAFEQSYGTAHVVYPEATDAKCTAALLLEVDPIRLVRGRARSTPDFSLGQYVNDRPYAASSLLSVAIGAVFRTALHGRCDLRPELARTPLPLRVALPSVPCRGGAAVAERLFAPLGWTVTATPLPLDPAFPDWGDSHLLRIELDGTVRLSDALSHLYVLLPVLDGAKHYLVADEEVDKLIRAGGGWLGGHPERGWITRRYLARRQSLVRTALARLAEVDDVEPEQLDAVDETDDAEPSHDSADVVRSADAVTRTVVGGALDAAGTTATAVPGAAPEGECLNAAEASDRESDGTAGATSGSASDDSETSTRTPALAVVRRAAVLAALHEAGVRRVLDLGCGEGALLRDLLADTAFSEIVGVDVSMRALHIAERRLRVDHLPEQVSRRLTLRQGALTYTDARLRGYDAAVLMEVIEHVDPPRLGALEHAVFTAAVPTTVVVTTPNAEINERFEGLTARQFRHADHRFEWTRAEFADWSGGVAARHGYTVRYVPIGVADPELGPPTQMAVFTKRETRDGS
ncbi:3' terminal RNA ribose 2'-O-methyltransferase Hen1 [Nocardia sp. NBC_01730]|uniref:3' terminal RNA ribose 2'-O-methyltransferase Hen1 n=1 Tax=Nocardia sp. NBC_01730 TaxID=2975998 RepID=UPI002E0EFC86|nr:3' terminal RNA ribose 2'-O-methyltransferase Hen1 [Nocardia sp. NBC_01730]